MANQPRGGPALPFAGFLILAALGSIIWKTGPLESSRPLGDSSGVQEQHGGSAHARLWQDPFNAIQSSIDTAAPSAIKTKPISCQIQKTTAPCEHDGVPQVLTIIGVMVSKGNYAEIEERRRRRRYATLSGITNAGFVPVETETIRYLRINGPDCPADNDGNAPASCQEIIPYEWFEPDEYSHGVAPNQHALVLWLNEEIFSQKPYVVMANLVKLLTGEARDLASGSDPPADDILPCMLGSQAKQNIEMFMIGPARSQLLRKMVVEARKPTFFNTATADGGKENYKRLYDTGIKGLHILSATATVGADDLVKNTDHQSYTALNQLMSADKCNAFEPTCVTFSRTIRDDDTVLQAIHGELTKRIPGLCAHSVVLISEWDTYFGRALPRTFENYRNKKCGAGAADIYQFSYLRGIDGRVSSNVKDLGKTTQKTVELSNSGTKQPAALFGQSGDIRRPVGTGQYDYLRRLASTLRDLNRTRRFEEGKGISAIGVLGSDVYDKLLILRALRKEFPGVLFFTTDMDSQLLHPDELNWTRNLIVGSSFGLQLNKELQRHIPPFRNSYQTSVFLSTMMAFNPCLFYGGPACERARVPPQSYINEAIKPLVFEVGNSGAVSLPQEGKKIASVHPERPKRFAGKIGFVLLLIAIIILFVLHQSVPSLGRETLWLGISIVLFAILASAVVYFSRNNEPLSFTAGVSVWPGTFLRFATLLLAIYFIVAAVIGLRNNTRRLSRDYHLSGRFDIPPPSHAPTLREALQTLRRLPATIKKNYAYVLCVTLAFASLVVIMGLVARKLTLDNIGSFALIWTVFIGVWYWLIYYPCNIRSINQWVVSLRDKPNLDATELWDEYYQWGDTRQRVLRTLALTILYMAFASIVFKLLPSADYLCRGDGCGLVRIVLIPGVIAMLFLIFFVTDATRLCINWLKSLGKKQITWSKQTLEACRARLNIDDETICEWLKIRLIADRTQEVGQLLYYPFIIIILMLLSRSTYFDNWTFPQALAIVVGVNVVILVSVSVLLRHAAETVRSTIVDRLEAQRVKLLGPATEAADAGVNQHRANQIDLLIGEIKAIREGIFRPFLEQPLVRGGLLLIGGLSVSFSEYLRLSY
jgi:hypothetical protein